MRIGFDHDKYTAMQSQHIRERISQFGGKLYLELGGKLFDDNHASRVLPGFRPDSKMSMLLNLKDQAELVIAINADDIEKSDDLALACAEPLIYPPAEDKQRGRDQECQESDACRNIRYQRHRDHDRKGDAGSDQRPCVPAERTSVFESFHRDSPICRITVLFQCLD